MILAIIYISLNIIPADDCITAIEFEDGGGYKFNYHTRDNKASQFIDLTGLI